MAQGYASLNTFQNSIRLLHLAPAANAKEPIQCRFTITSLDHQPRFKALSYVWGESSGACSVKDRDHVLPVTDNLYAALRRLRLQDEELTLWVDALCINQSDLTEKMGQVSFMAKIFGQATEVIVWLGDGWEGSDQAMDFLRMLGDDASLHLDPSISPYVMVEGQTLRSADLRGHLLRLFTRPWWQRTWTIQEFVLAQNLVFQCGMNSVSRHTMYMARENFWAHKDRCCPSRLLEARDHDTGMTLQGAFEVPARLDFISKSRGNCYSVLTPITTFCERGVTNPCDRVYGMLGLGTGPYADLVKADYSLTPEQVCQELAFRSVERTGKLEFLSHLFEHENKSLPSFIPNWTGHFKWFGIYALWLGHISGFRASGDTKAQYQRIGSSMLNVAGMVVDRISATCSACLIERIRDPDYTPELLELACPNSSFREPYVSTNEPRLLTFWHTLNGGVEMILEDTNRYHRRLRGSSDLSRCFKFVEFMTSANRREMWNTEIELILLDVETGTRGRTMFTTEKGYLGVGSSKCQKGDLVVVLLGGNVPFIVRPAPPQESRDCFTILGDAYVHGIMDGEALFSQDGSNRDIQEFVLV